MAYAANYDLSRVYRLATKIKTTGFFVFPHALKQCVVTRLEKNLTTETTIFKKCIENLKYTNMLNIVYRLGPDWRIRPWL